MHHDVMTRLRSLLITAAVAGAVLAPAATAQGAPTTLAVESAPTRVAAWNGTVLWSRFDPATQLYTLVKSVGATAPVPVGVAPRRLAPFDIDLGTNRSGATYAVYTRNDGDIYRLNVATGTETKLDKLSSLALVERDPTIQRGEIAFVRRNGGRDELRIGNTTRGSKGSRLLVRNRRSILKPELGSQHIAYVVTGPGPISDEGSQYLRVRNLRTSADRPVYRAVSGGANFANITRPTWMAEPAGFFWARTNQGSGRGNRLIRYTLRGSRLSYAKGSAMLNSTAWAGAALGAVVTSSLTGDVSPQGCAEAANLCRVELTGPLQFNLGP